MIPMQKLELTEFRVVLVDPTSRKLLVLNNAGTICLIRVSIPRGCRPVQEICAVLKGRWGLSALIVEVFGSAECCPMLVVAEHFGGKLPKSFSAIRPDQLPDNEISPMQRASLSNVLESKVDSPLASVGWFDEAVSWVEQTSGRKLSAFMQYNAGKGFALLSFQMIDGSCYWLKATGHPNRHEFDMVTCLCHACPEFLPSLVASRRDWNAWLTQASGTPISQETSVNVLLRAIYCLGSLQQRTLRIIDKLLAAGAVDLCTSILTDNVDRIIDYLSCAMAWQAPGGPAPIMPARLWELGGVVRKACLRMEALGIPNTLVHNDLNDGNILWDGDRCVLIDWSEAAIGNPFLSLDRICRQHPASQEALQRFYASFWIKDFEHSRIETAYHLAPLVGVYSHLLSHVNSAKDTSVRHPQREKYARSLARHLNREACNPLLLEAISS